VSPHPWELAWKEGRWQELSPPLPAVAQFAEHLKQVEAISILDLGCGAGRHAIFLAKAGFHVTGLDVSETALAELHGRMKKDAITGITLVKHEMLELPFIDDYFDAILSTNVLHHGRRVEIKKTIAEVHRVLKVGGTGCVVTLSKNDFRYGDGKRLEPDTFQFTKGDEKGIVHHFFTEREARSVFGPFEILDFEENLIPVERGNRAHFLLRIRKT